MPTEAHRAIARLVKGGYVRAILTTNFDRLIETGLHGENVSFDVVHSEDMLRGAVPLVHSRCTVVKLHGDYRDTRLLNTEEELSRYTPTWDALLDRVIDEFGLVICGWSARWDIALREAILRAPNRRYTMFWLGRGSLDDSAQTIVTHRHGVVIPIQGAEEFLPALADRVEALARLRRPHPVSVELAVEEVKRAITDPTAHISLHDLVSREVELIRQEIAGDRFDLDATITAESMQTRLLEYEALSEKLLAMLGALAYHDDGRQSGVLARAIERLADLPRPMGRHQSVWNELRLYPALLASYVSGVAAIANNRYENLAAVVLRPRVSEDTLSVQEPAVFVLNALHFYQRAAPEFVPSEEPRRIREARWPFYLIATVRRLLADFIPSDREFGLSIEVYESMVSMACHDLNHERRYPRRNPRCVPYGTYIFRYPFEDAARDPRLVKIAHSREQLLEAGFFEGERQRFTDVLQEHEEELGQTRGRLR